MSLRLPALLAALLILPLPLLASTTYTYTGDTYDYINTTTYTSSDFVSGSFTVPTALGPNFSGLVHPTSFSFSDGVQSVTKLDGFYYDLTIVTDSSGDIFNWIVVFGTPSTFGRISTKNINNSRVDFASIDAAIFASSFGTTNVWTVTATPEPATITLTATGLLGIIAASRRRFLRSSCFHHHSSGDRLG